MGDRLGDERRAASEHVQIFAEGSFIKGDLTWGWQCFRCREEETGFGSATTAGEGRDAHEALTCAPAPAVVSDTDEAGGKR